ncbi:MAG: hypothetical protein SFY95_03120 [Planctomycetota bacterium]|nr:hypothetical protein [Planctomycetota bacterium]
MRLLRMGDSARDAAPRWALALESFDPASPPAGVRVLKRENTSGVFHARFLGREVVIKSRVTVGLWARLRQLFRPGKAWRQWEGAQWLRAQNLPTAEPLVLASRRSRAGLEELLVLAHVPGKTLLEHLADASLPVRLQHVLAREAGRLVAAMVLPAPDMRGRFNRDHKPSNLLVPRLTPAGAEIAVIDTVDLRPILRPKQAAGFARRMLASMVIEPTGCGVPPRRALMARALVACWHELACRADASGRVRQAGYRPGAMRATQAGRLARLHLRRQWERIARLIEAHGDPTPKVNPLSTPSPGAEPAAGG